MRVLLAIPLIYQVFSDVIGMKRTYRHLVQNYFRPRPNDAILDIGCGPADILAYLPPCLYMGVDESARYIASARRRYGDKGTFICESVKQVPLDRAGSFDLCLAIGVLHHLDDESALSLFRLAHHALKPGGRLITYDGCYVEGQSSIARYLLSRDRGQFVRTETEYLCLAKSLFMEIHASLRHDLLRIPYTHIIMECTK